MGAEDVAEGAGAELLEEFEAPEVRGPVRGRPAMGVEPFARAARGGDEFRGRRRRLLRGERAAQLVQERVAGVVERLQRFAARRALLDMPRDALEAPPRQVADREFAQLLTRRAGGDGHS